MDCLAGRCQEMQDNGNLGLVLTKAVNQNIWEMNLLLICVSCELGLYLSKRPVNIISIWCAIECNPIFFCFVVNYHSVTKKTVFLSEQQGFLCLHPKTLYSYTCILRHAVVPHFIANHLDPFSQLVYFTAIFHAFLINQWFCIFCILISCWPCQSVSFLLCLPVQNTFNSQIYINL